MTPAGLNAWSRRVRAEAVLACWDGGEGPCQHTPVPVGQGAASWVAIPARRTRASCRCDLGVMLGVPGGGSMAPMGGRGGVERGRGMNKKVRVRGRGRRRLSLKFFFMCL